MMFRSRKMEFENYLSAVVDLKNDIAKMRDRKALYNIDFSIFYPFFWYPRRPKDISDRIRMNMFEAFCNHHTTSRMNFVFTRATVVEILQSVLHEIETSRNIRRDGNALDRHRRRLSALTRKLNLPIFKEIADIDWSAPVPDLQDNGYSASALADEILACYRFLPNDRKYQNLDKTIALMRSGVISSFYDHFDRRTIESKRPDIARLSTEVRDVFIAKPTDFRESSSKSLNLAVDSRNIASTIALNNVNGMSVSFVGAHYTVRHSGYVDIRRNHYVPSFWLQAIQKTGDFEAAEALIDNMMQALITCKKVSSPYNYLNSVPDYVVEEMAEFLIKYIDPMHSKKYGNLSFDDMYKKLANRTDSDTELRHSLEEAETSFKQKARDIVSAMEYDGDLLHGSDLEENPRARQVLREFGL